MSDHTTTSAAGDDATSRPRPAPGQGFFDWVRRLGLQRGDAWIGGVCGGIAARLGIDPIIVRGIAVVVALLGGPAFLLYALAWLLLPDTQGTIHLERLIGGVFDAAAAGVAIFVLLAFLPIAQGVWWAAAWPFGSAASWAVSLGKVFWSVLVIAAIVALVVWLSRRAGGRGGWGPSPWAGAGPGGYGTSASAAPEDGAGGAGAATSTAADPAPSGFVPGAAPTGPNGPAPADVADWRARQAEWRTRYDSWKVEEAARAEQRREQRRAQSAEAAKWQADALEKARLRRLASPRTSGAYVAASLGVALIVGAIAAAVSWGDASLHEFQAVYGFAAATVVIGVSMIVAGLSRRRSGFLAFVAIVLTVITVGLLASPSIPSPYSLLTYPFSLVFR
ncbi:PspC domain-containing protein [Frondihabitans australicus]|uniref:Phage shock protein C (PspC) family protein n=1 Tax=Frondihabitans australicus TaxID=386892 RepID=A0A495IJ31_9MICO|nr:PspC domain-containing protein [Frondihabitans australicus]RKR75779.1 phage shock protein C (PspC) family protein [Frondihabitans australicus]